MHTYPQNQNAAVVIFAGAEQLGPGLARAVYNAHTLRARPTGSAICCKVPASH